MFDAQDEVILVIAQIQVGVAPGVQVGAAAQCLSGALVGSGFAGVMDESDCGMKAPLQVSQRMQDGGDFCADVFIDAVQSGQRVQDQQSRLDALHGLEQQLLMMIKVEAQLLGIEDIDVEALAQVCAMLWSRWAMTCRASSAANSSTGPGWCTAKRCRHGFAEATATARCSARNDLQHFGWPPMMPTACCCHSDSTSQPGWDLGDVAVAGVQVWNPSLELDQLRLAGAFTGGSRHRLFRHVRR